MADVFTTTSATGFNNDPPPDDASEVEANVVEWAKHIREIGTPLKNYIDALQSNITSAFAKSALLGGVKAVATTYTLLSTDQGKVLNCTGTFTLTLLSASAAGDQFTVLIVNAGSGVVTVDGSGSETINGEASYALEPQGSVLITGDQSNWYGTRAFGNLAISSPSDGDLLTYSTANGEWENQPPSTIPIHVNNADGSPTISTTVFAADTSITENTWKSVGPDTAITTCYAYDGATYHDETTDVNSATADDVSVYLDLNDASYFGYDQEFPRLIVNVGTAATGGAITWEYWNGTIWTALSGVSDGTTGYQTAGTNDLTFTVPGDWATTTVDVSGSLYWIRGRVSTTLTGTPALTQAWIAADNSWSALDGVPTDVDWIKIRAVVNATETGGTPGAQLDINIHARKYGSSATSTALTEIAGASGTVNSSNIASARAVAAHEVPVASRFFDLLWVSTLNTSADVDIYLTSYGYNS